jgi:hypothetical protein
MPTLPKPAESVNFAPPPAGTQLATCYRIIDLGTQQVEWQGTIKRQHKILLSWELPDELMPDGEKAGEPFTIHQRYTYSTHEKATFRKHLEAWRGLAFTDADFGPGGFDIKNVLGKSCLLTVVHNAKNDKVYANIASVSKLPKAMTAPEQPHNPVQFLWLDQEEYDHEVFDGLSDGLKEVIRKSPEYAILVTPNGGEHVSDAPAANGHDHDIDDEIPF